jgi:hypothetical protein
MYDISTVGNFGDQASAREDIFTHPRDTATLPYSPATAHQGREVEVLPVWRSVLRPSPS